MPIVERVPIGQRAPWLTLPLAASAAPAKRRILETANRLFYDDGIRSVGIDRLISESGVTKATFYKHYGSKDRLIVAYVAQRHLVEKQFVDDLIAEADGPEGAIRALLEVMVTAIEAPGFRGCPFINAATEFTDSRHAVRQLVTEHREWYADTLAGLLRDIGHPLPGEAGDDLILVRDGAMTGGYAGDPVAATTALVRGAERILAEARR